MRSPMMSGLGRYPMRRAVLVPLSAGRGSDLRLIGQRHTPASRELCASLAVLGPPRTRQKASRDVAVRRTYQKSVRNVSARFTDRQLQSANLQALLQSPLTDSNRRPPPYHRGFGRDPGSQEIGSPPGSSCIYAVSCVVLTLPRSSLNDPWAALAYPQNLSPAAIVEALLAFALKPTRSKTSARARIPERPCISERPFTCDVSERRSVRAGAAASASGRQSSSRLDRGVTA
jgi:hypothetical protein